MKVIDENLDKIHSNVLHNSVDHVLKSQVGTDAYFGWHPFLDSSWEEKINKYSKHNIWVGVYDIMLENINVPNFYEFKHNTPLSKSNNIGFASRCEGRKNPHYLDGLKSFIFTNSFHFKTVWKGFGKYDYSKSKIYHYDSKFKDIFYNMDWGISHSAFTSEPFGYSIFEAVDRGKLPILHSTWCKDFKYPYRVSSKKDFVNIYSSIKESSYSEKNKWFILLKQYMIDNYSNKNMWVDKLLTIYNI